MQNNTICRERIGPQLHGLGVKGTLLSIWKIEGTNERPQYFEIRLLWRLLASLLVMVLHSLVRGTILSLSARRSILRPSPNIVPVLCWLSMVVNEAKDEQDLLLIVGLDILMCLSMIRLCSGCGKDNLFRIGVFLLSYLISSTIFQTCPQDTIQDVLGWLLCWDIVALQYWSSPHLRSGAHSSRLVILRLSSRLLSS